MKNAVAQLAFPNLAVARPRRLPRLLLRGDGELFYLNRVRV